MPSADLIHKIYVVNVVVKKSCQFALAKRNILKEFISYLINELVPIIFDKKAIR